MKTLRSGLPRPDAVLLRLRLIGRMEALTLGNESVLPLGRKTRGLLAILALSGRQPVLRLRLAELLWSRRSEEQARASLRQEIHRLLEALSPLGTDVIAVERHTLALKPALTSVDAERILTANPGHAEALPPFDGILLEELNGTDPAFDQWLAAERIRLRVHAIGLFEDLLRRQRDPQGMLDAARQLLGLDGLHERAWQATIMGQTALGEVVLARQSAERCMAAFTAADGAVAGPDLAGVLAALGLRPEHGASAIPFDLQARPAGGGAADGGPGPANGVAPAHAPSLASSPASSVASSVAPGLARSPAANPASSPVPGYAAEPVKRLGDTPESRIAAVITGKPLVAILPVLELDAHPSEAGRGFPGGLVSAIQTALAGGDWMRLLVGSELEDSLSHGRDDAMLRRSFGLDYLIDGTVARSAGRLRVILRMIDIRRHGQLVWAERFDGDGQDPIGLQDLIAARIAARLPAELMFAESRHLRRMSESELDPQGLAVQALGRLDGGDRRQIDQVIPLLNRSVERGGDHATSYAILATAHLLRGLQRWDDTAQETVLAEAAARAALEGNPSSRFALTVCAHVLSELQDRPEAALGLTQHVIALFPHAAEAFATACYPLIRLGRLDEAARSFATYRSLFGTHPLHILLDMPEVMIALLQGDDETAARLGLIHSEIRPNFAPVLVPYLAALGHLHHAGEADRIRARLLGFWPRCTVSGLVRESGLRLPAQAERLRRGLSLAGLAEDEPSPQRSARIGTPRRKLGVEPVAG